MGPPMRRRRSPPSSAIRFATFARTIKALLLPEHPHGHARGIDRFLDDDDLWDPDHLRMVVPAFEDPTPWPSIRDVTIDENNRRLPRKARSCPRAIVRHASLAGSSPEPVLRFAGHASIEWGCLTVSRLRRPRPVALAIRNSRGFPRCLFCIACTEVDFQRTAHVPRQAESSPQALRAG